MRLPHSMSDLWISLLAAITYTWEPTVPQKNPLLYLNEKDPRINK